MWLHLWQRTYSTSCADLHRTQNSVWPPGGIKKTRSTRPYSTERNLNKHKAQRLYISPKGSKMMKCCGNGTTGSETKCSPRASALGTRATCSQVCNSARGPKLRAIGAEPASHEGRGKENSVPTSHEVVGTMKTHTCTPVSSKAKKLCHTPTIPYQCVVKMADA